MTVYTPPGHIMALISTEGLRWLHETSKTMGEVVEVGSWRGASTHAFLTGCPGLVHVVDHWMGSPDPADATHNAAKEQDIFGQFVANVGMYPHLRIHKMLSVDAAKEFADRSVDMVFIDAGHDTPSISADLAAWFPKCRKLICGHDWSHRTVEDAVNNLGCVVETRPGDIWSIRCDA